jgi:hypothetical protein
MVLGSGMMSVAVHHSTLFARRFSGSLAFLPRCVRAEYRGRDAAPTLRACCCGLGRSLPGGLLCEPGMQVGGACEVQQGLGKFAALSADP